MVEKYYRGGLHGGLLSVVHAICAHEQTYGNGVDPCFEWQVGSLALSPANLDFGRGNGFRVRDAVLLMDEGETTLGIRDSDDPRVADDDSYAREFLQAFGGYLRQHMRTDHQLCVEDLERRAADAAAAPLVPRFRSATTGEVLVS